MSEPFHDTSSIPEQNSNDTGAEPVRNQHQFGTRLVPNEYYAYISTKDINDGVRYAARLAIDRARRAGNNPRTGIVTIRFDDAGVGAWWTKEENA